ncbi:hypothetical protein BDR04DRAFT_1111269 [Suillus decipiens]|nr:hypothetical protein BDR04DRAFT_1111269 [Suillus decipiens]
MGDSLSNAKNHVERNAKCLEMHVSGFDFVNRPDRQRQNETGTARAAGVAASVLRRDSVTSTVWTGSNYHIQRTGSAYKNQGVFLSSSD